MIYLNSGPMPPPGPANFILLAAIIVIYRMAVKRRT
jgi:hypothetical protein